MSSQEIIGLDCDQRKHNAENKMKEENIFEGMRNLPKNGQA